MMTEAPNTRKRLQVQGELIYAIASKMGWLRTVREVLDGGGSEEVARGRVKELLRDDGLTFSQFMFPSINRRSRRVPLKVAVQAWIDGLVGKRRKTVGELLDSVAAQLGWDDWMADSIVQMAQTGEATPYHPLAGGRVVIVQKGLHGEDEPTVWAVATSASEPSELAEAFLEACRTTFPKETWSVRNRNTEAAYFLRRSIEGATDQEIAEEVIGQEELDRLDRLGPLVRQQRVGQEADRIRHARERLWESLDKILG